MADQATIDRPPRRPTRIRTNLAGLAHDALTLIELQVQLLGVDLRDAGRGARTAFVQVIVGVVLALGCVPVLLLALAQLLIETANWPGSAAYAVMGLGAALLAAGLLWWGWRTTRQAVTTVQRSRTELTETIQWLKDSLRPAESDEAPWDAAER